MNGTAFWWAVGGNLLTAGILIALNYRPSQIRPERALRRERHGVR